VAKIRHASYPYEAFRLVKETNSIQIIILMVVELQTEISALKEKNAP
jgi:hypothetical protein